MEDLMKFGITLAALVSLALTCTSHAAEIKLLGAGATQESLLELFPEFQRSSGNTVAAKWSGSVDIKKRVTAGEVYDVVTLPSPDIDVLIQEGKLVPESRADLMKSGIGLAVRTGTQKPDVFSSDSLKKTLLAVKSIGYSTGASGTYLQQLLQRMGIAEQVKPKMKQTPSGVTVGSIVASGEVELGVQQVSELIHFPGIVYIGPLPADIQQVTVFSAAILTVAGQSLAARELVKFLTSPVSAAVIKKHGMEPG
jgi:molybdate transport system substrate-binding protein